MQVYLSGKADSLKEYSSNVKLIVLFGEAKIRIEDFAKKCGIPCKVVNSLGEATEIAYNFYELNY